MNKLFKIRKNKGFTLAETLVTIFVFSILMLGTSLLLRDIFSNSKQDLMVINNDDQARRIVNGFVNELRNGNYGGNGAYPIAQADDTQIIFFSTIPSNNGKSSRIRYYVTGNTLYKGVTKLSANGTTYDTNTEVVTTLLSILSLDSNPLFYYYDGSYNGASASLLQPVNINDVKFIRMNLTVLKQSTKNSTGTFTVSAGGSIRNLKTNLGN